MRKIKVLHFANIINHNDFIDVIVRYADSDRFVMMACSYRGFSNIEEPKYRTLKIPYFQLSIDHGWFGMIAGAWRLARILKSEKIDILHTHHYYEAVIGRAACFLHPGTRHVIGRHYHDQFYLTTKGLKLRLYLFVEHFVNSLASAIVVPSTAIVSLLKRQGVKEKKIKFIPYAFDFENTRYQPTDCNAQTRAEFGWTEKFIIGNIGRHHTIKGQTYLLRAFKKIIATIPNSMLVLIGDGPANQQVRDEIRDLGIGANVQLLGWRRDARELINCMDVVVHPTLQEAFPQLMIEVMALQKPLLITPVSGATDVIHHMVTGLLISFRDHESIVDNIMWLKANPDEAKRLAKEGRKFVTANYGTHKVIPLFEALYSELSSHK